MNKSIMREYAFKFLYSLQFFKDIDEDNLALLIKENYLLLKSLLDYPDWKTDVLESSIDKIKENLSEEMHSEWTKSSYGSMDYKINEQILSIVYGNEDFK